MIFANKQDTPGAASETEIRAGVIPKISGDAKPRDIHVQCGSALTGDGVFEVLDWLAARMNKL